MNAANTPRGSLHLKAFDESGVRISSSHSTAIDPEKEFAVMQHAWDMHHAARRQGKDLVIAILPHWQSRILNWLGWIV